MTSQLDDLVTYLFYSIFWSLID